MLVDDESMARDRMRRFLSSQAHEINIFEADNAVKALELIKLNKIDILFLDIQMPVMTGFDLLYQLADRPFQIVFQTAYDEFAVQAFEQSACDYLLKPYTEERFLKAFYKAVNLQDQKLQFLKLEEHLEKSKLYLNTIVSKTGAVSKIIKIDDIYAFKSEDHYTFALSDKAEHIVEQSLQSLEKYLDPIKFLRAHRNNIVRLDQITQIGGVENLKVVLKNGQEFHLSREGRKKLQSYFEKT